MKSFITKVQKTIHRYGMLDDGMVVVVAVSGGPDSVALLHALHQLKPWYPSLTLLVAHFNHQLRGRESDADEIFVRELASKLELAFTSAQQDTQTLAQQRKQNLEEVARQERYRFLRKVVTDVGARRIATGHTLNDQAETVLMRLVRGAGTAGLSAIHPIVDDLIIRPLLDVTREDVRAYCEQIEAVYRLDHTNVESTFFRNRIRHEILPRLTDSNPNVLASLARAAANARVDEAYFDELVPQLMRDCMVLQSPHTAVLKIAPLVALHPALRHRLFRAAIRHLRGDVNRITQQHLEAMDNLIQPGSSGKHVQLPGLTSWREFDMLTLTLKKAVPRPTSQALANACPVTWGSFRFGLQRGLLKEAVPRAPGVVIFDDATLPDHLHIRARRPGDRYVPAGHHQPQKLKRLMIEYKIPLTERDHWPIIASAEDDRIVWALNLPVPAAFAPGPHTQTFAAILCQPF